MSVRHAIKLLGGIIDGRRVVMARRIQGNSRGSERELPELFRYAATVLGFALSSLAPSSIRLLCIHMPSTGFIISLYAEHTHTFRISATGNTHRDTDARTTPADLSHTRYVIRVFLESLRIFPRGAPKSRGSPSAFQVRGSRLKRVRARSSFHRRRYGALRARISSRAGAITSAGTLASAERKRERKREKEGGRLLSFQQK